MKIESFMQPLAPLIRLVQRYHVYLIILVLFGVFVKVSLDLSQVVNPPQNEELYEQKLGELESNRIRLDEALISQIQQRTIKGPNVIPPKTGNPNPFD
jgi:hypothetical protein